MELKMLKQGFPKVITDLPEADIKAKGVKGWIAQGENHQIIFFEMEPLTELPEHQHDYPQWGIVVEGEMELTVDGKTATLRKGDEYLIPTHARHSAKFPTKFRAIDLFSEKTRYTPKTR
jgi:quercetin dioxygenase-like cupin family protein